MSLSVKSRSNMPPPISTKLMPTEIVKEDTLEDLLSPIKHDEVR